MRPKLEKRHYDNALPLACWEGQGFDFVAHLHPEVELCLLLEGSLTVGINGDTRSLSAGWLSVCGSHDIHHYRRTPDPARHVMLIFRPELAGYPGVWPVGRQLTSHFVSPEQTGRLGLLIRELASEAILADDFQSAMVRGLLAQLCAVLDRHFTAEAGLAPRSPRLQGHARMGQAIEYIRTHSHEDLRLEDAAASINMSPWHFSRTFPESCGQNFSDYLNGVRLEQADDLLAKADMKVVDIALECGFGSVRSFNRVWRDMRGGSPRRTAPVRSPGSVPPLAPVGENPGPIG